MTSSHFAGDSATLPPPPPDSFASSDVASFTTTSPLGRPVRSTFSIVCSGPISDPLLALLVRTSQSVIICAPPAAPSSSSSPSASTSLPDLTPFLHNLVRRCAPVTPSVLLLATSYLARLERKLPPTARGLACTVHRIMLAALLIATKYLHDGPVRNRHWAANSGLFSLPEVNLMERQLLFLLEFELATDEGVLAALVDATPEIVAAATMTTAVAVTNTTVTAMTTKAAFEQKTLMLSSGDGSGGADLECVAQAAELSVTATTMALVVPTPRLQHAPRIDSSAGPARQVHNHRKQQHNHHPHHPLHHHQHHHSNRNTVATHPAAAAAHRPPPPPPIRLELARPPAAVVVAPITMLDPATIAAMRITVAAAQNAALLSSSAAAAASAAASASAASAAAVAVVSAQSSSAVTAQQQRQQGYSHPQPVY
ncbi:hypothetical protein HDU89_004408 [Geranomyces variabilis]|nr:hypothetical protein HDU89_004408 [Geranomyces variabilis]